jgi:RimJ/RimL family protein N-acetyltransferase
MIADWIAIQADGRRPRYITLVKALGWREVGVHRRHGRLDGQWKDVVVVELLLNG